MTGLMIMRLSIAATLATLAFIAVLTSTSTAPAESATSALPMCVEDITRVPESVEAAVAELDSVPELDVTYHRGVGACPHGVLVDQDDYGTDLPFAWLDTETSRDGVVHLNVAGRSLTEHQVTTVVLHELMHLVTLPADGELDHGGHTNRCDSVLSDDRGCIFALDGLTAYDRAWIARTHSPEDR